MHKYFGIISQVNDKHCSRYASCNKQAKDVQQALSICSVSIDNKITFLSWHNLEEFPSHI